MNKFNTFMDHNMTVTEMLNRRYEPIENIKKRNIVLLDNERIYIITDVKNKEKEANRQPTIVMEPTKETKELIKAQEKVIMDKYHHSYNQNNVDYSISVESEWFFSRDAKIFNNIKDVNEYLSNMVRCSVQETAEEYDER